MNDILSKREYEVLQLTAHELNIKQIASRLYVSHHTIISHRKNILRKLKVKNSAGMVRRAFELGILKLQLISVAL